MMQRRVDLFDECCTNCENFDHGKCRRHVVYRKLEEGGVEKIEYPIEKSDDYFCSFYEYIGNFVHN